MNEVWNRSDHFGERFAERSLEEFTGPPAPVQWLSENPYADEPTADMLRWLSTQIKWRYHHDIPAIRNAPGFYSAYAQRTETMLRMVDDALEVVGLEPQDSSFVDLGAAEGYVGNHLFDRGATDIDSCDLNQGNIERMWKVRAYTKRSYGRIGSIELENAAWSESLGRAYDVALALGIVYHMENPLLFCRNLREVAPVAVVESDTPVFPHNERFRGYGNVYMHRDQVTISAGKVRYLCELRPDRQALAEMLLNAGYEHVELIEPKGDEISRYFLSGEKSVMVASSAG